MSIETECIYANIQERAEIERSFRDGRHSSRALMRRESDRQWLCLWQAPCITPVWTIMQTLGRTLAWVTTRLYKQASPPPLLSIPHQR